MNYSNPHPTASIAKNNKQWVKTCLYQADICCLIQASENYKSKKT